MNKVILQFINKEKESAMLYEGVIEKMLNDTDEYEYAEDILVGILEYIKKEGYITAKQIEAVNNIKDKPTIEYEEW